MIGPLGCLVLGVSLILVFVLYFRFPAFLALITAALAVAACSDRIPLVESVSLVTANFGTVMGQIGILLAMAAIIGKCMMDSGAADRIVRTLCRLFGEERQHYSLLTSGYILSIPVFFDTVFYLLAPLARAIYARRKRDYALLICATAAGGAITHALVPPTPGPIIVAEQLGMSLGMTMVVGIIAGIVPAIVGGIFYGQYINRRLDLHPQDVMGVSQKDLEIMAAKPTSELPGLFFSLSPILLPVFMIAISTSIPFLVKAGSFATLSPEATQSLLNYAKWLGDKNLVFMLGAFLAAGLVMSQNQYNFRETFKKLEPAILSGAMIAFITCAGGAFGATLAAAQVGEVIQQWAATLGISLLTLSFLTAALIRIAQGSATVAMMTTASIIAPALATMEPNFHPILLVPMIGFGATTTSWMNDSGFWIVGQMAGISEKDTLKVWTALLTIIAVSGYFWVLFLAYVTAWIFPLG
ncbi:MAG: SLC13 family permease [bacterium]|jgi:GntP family gluconate:H+ symporter|nr:SLC13 family permease [bacterium]